jgi:hypothetical protein
VLEIKAGVENYASERPLEIIDDYLRHARGRMADLRLPGAYSILSRIWAAVVVLQHVFVELFWGAARRRE